jgi:hypothetical protein
VAGGAPAAYVLKERLGDADTVEKRAGSTSLEWNPGAWLPHPERNLSRP